MISIENTELNDYTSEDTKDVEIENLIKRVRNISKTGKIIVVIVNLMLFIAYLICLYVTRKFMFFLLSPGKAFSTFLAITLFFGFLMFITRRLIFKISHKLQKSYIKVNDKGVSKKLLKNTIRFLYRDMKENHLRILKLDNNLLEVSAMVENNMVNFKMPMEYTLFAKDENRIDFYDDHIDIYLTHELIEQIN